MVVSCTIGSMLYVLPMLLGRTFDMNLDTVGIDIYDKKYIDAALHNPIINPKVSSEYTQIEDSSDKRDFLGISGDLALKISSGLLDIRGAGDYLKATSKTTNKLEILVKMTFNTMWVEINADAKPLNFWQLLDRRTVGTHVVNSILYGGEIYASVNFVALKAEYMQDIRAQVKATLSSKSGAFDLDAQGDVSMLAQNLSSMAKLEIDYYGTVPLDGVPTTVEGLSKLVNEFQDQVAKISNGRGVPLCVKFDQLSKWDNKFGFNRNMELNDALDHFNYLFNDLREAKGLLKGLIDRLPTLVSKDYLKEIIDFSGRLTDTLRAFHNAIGNLDLEQGSGQLNKAEEAFDTNSKVSGDNRYSKEINRIIDKLDPTMPRGVYIEWGSKTCTNQAANSLYIGFMASFLAESIGAGSQYQCLPENPDFTLPPNATGFNVATSKLGGVRYSSMSVFKDNGKRIEDKVATCVACETPMRPTVLMFPGLKVCPGDWVSEYSGFLVSSRSYENRGEHVCVTRDPDVYDTQSRGPSDPVVLPLQISAVNLSGYKDGASVPCSVCSK